MAKKKLVILISHPIQYHAPLYRRMAKEDIYDVHVLYHNDRGVRPFFDKFANASVSYDNDLLSGYTYEFLTKGEPSGRLEKIKRMFMPGLVKRLVSLEPDAVYFHGYDSPAHIRAILAMRKHGIKVFFRGENEDVLPRPAWKTFLRETLLKILLPRFDAVLTIGQENRRFFTARGIPEQKLFFAPYSADNAYFGMGMKEDEVLGIRQKVCAEYGIGPSSMIFINTCKHREEKRPLDVVRGFIHAFKEGTVPGGAEPVLMMVGDGPQNAELKKMASESGVRGIIFAGFVNQSKMRELLLASDFLVNPGAEPWGCVYNEALPAGLGIISSDKVVGHPDMVHEDKNGYVFRFGDIEALAKIFRKCVSMKEIPPSFRLESKKIAALYSYETCVKGFNDALQRTAQGTSKK